MILEFLLNIVFNVAYSALSALPEIEWSIESSGFDFFLNAVRVAGYLFPADVIRLIGTFLIGTTILRIGIASVKSLWDLLPVV